MKDVAIIGTGRLGTSLARALARAGHRLVGLADADLKAARRARRIVGQGQATNDPGRAARDAEVVFLCVPDEAIRPVAAKLARSLVDWRGKTVFQTSGLTPAAALRPLRLRGASTASFHPIQSFPRPTMPPARFRRIFIGIEGDRGAVSTGRRIIRTLGARPLPLRGCDKAMYHAACSVASNLFVPLFDLACEVLERAGIAASRTEKVLLPLLEGTLQSVKQINRTNALTGPLARADAASVRRHLRTLRSVPRAKAAYRLLGKQALAVLTKKGMPAREVRRLRALLEEKRPLPQARPRTSPGPAR
jgi:predicted short-subunit dehydrogenase-like oxidoreductase (DUF2520 family)